MWKPGQSGNPLGRLGEKPWRDALRRALAERAKGKGDPHAIDRIAKKVVALAESGDMRAVSEIGQRMDGNPVQEIDQTLRYDTMSDNDLDAEIRSIIAEGFGKAAVAAAARRARAQKRAKETPPTVN